LDYNKYRGLTLYQAFSKNAKESADEPCTIFKNKVFNLNPPNIKCVTSILIENLLKTVIFFYFFVKN
jgi:hypothetical protein